MNMVRNSHDEINNIADVLAAIEFDKTGTFLATGDKGGRVVVLESDGGKAGVHYKFHCEFQSHEEEFDYVRSLAIEERINKIKWCKPSNDSLYMLTTNDKAIKLWKIYEKKLQAVTEWNLPPAMPSADGLTMIRPAAKVEAIHLPRLEIAEQLVLSKLRRGFAVDVHQFHINSMSVNSDGETFLSADNLRINMWNLGYPDRAFTAVDTKPDNMQDLVEVITAADFHPVSCNEFLFANSKGGIRLGEKCKMYVFLSSISEKDEK
jgi:serine/threonine-protein phosphatase 2A regulatory subunit B